MVILRTQRETDGQQAPLIPLPHTRLDTVHVSTSYFSCGLLGFEFKTSHLHSKLSYPLSPSIQDLSYLHRELLVQTLAFLCIYLIKGGCLNFSSFAVGFLFIKDRVSIFQVDFELLSSLTVWSSCPQLHVLACTTTASFSLAVDRNLRLPEH